MGNGQLTINVNPWGWSDGDIAMVESWAGVAGVVSFAEAAVRLRPDKQKALDATKPFKGSKRRKKRREPSEGDYLDEIIRFRCALMNLAENNGDPVDIIRYMDPLFGDAMVIRQHLYHAVRWINRFAEEWDREQRTHGNTGQVQQGSE
jgi:hypothetical protein